MAASLQGQLAKGGYANVLPTLSTTFGAKDAPRFAALWSAVSPRQLNENAIEMALDAWHGWVKAGRPSDPRAIARAIKPHVSGLWESRGPNAIAALAAEDPAAVALGGNKVSSFHPNLLGDPQRVTVDAINAKGQGINPLQLDNAAPYLGASAQVRRVAEKLGWTPAESQETMWSTIRASLGVPKNDASLVTPEMAGQQWNPEMLADLFNQEPYAGKLQQLGLTPPPVSSAEPPGLRYPAGDKRDLRRLSRIVREHGAGRYLLPGMGLLGLGAGATDGLLSDQN